MGIFRTLQSDLKKFLLKKFFVTFLILLVNLSFYGPAISSLLQINLVYAYTSTDGFYDCGTSWPSYSQNEECYIRGTYIAHSGWNVDAQCNMTNRIEYSSTNQNYYFCDPARTAQLTGREVIAFVRWNANNTFIITRVAELAETFNQVPNQPAISTPQSGWQMGPRTNGDLNGVNCNTTGTGQGCSVQFRTTSTDPDFYQWVRLEAQLTRTQGGNQNYTQQLTSNNQSFTSTRTLLDGNWSFRARNCDTTSQCSGYTSARTFVVDTTAPTGVVMVEEPEYTSGTQNTVSSTVGTDNLIGGIQYQFEMDTDPSFLSPEQSSGWISQNSYTFASLEDETLYYYRVRAKDSLDNTTQWSSAVSSTQDSILPTLENISVDNERISPENNDGFTDNVTLSFEWIEAYPEYTRLEILDSSDNVIRTITDLISSGTNIPVDHQFIWNGRNDASELVIDGAYRLRIIFRDLAGNEAIDESVIIMVDNVAADINISTPVDGSWFSNQSSVSINGQTEQDALATITNNQTSTQTQLTLDNLGLFTQVENISLGENSFTFFAQDIVQNTQEVLVRYFREESVPTINSISPIGIINNRRVAIELDLSDFGYSDSGNDYISGIDSDSVFISLTHAEIGELVLVNNGVNTQPDLGNIQQDCDSAGIFGLSASENCTYSFVFTSDLTPDGEYTITAKVKDIAGNSAIDRTQTFELDSNILSNISTPSNGNLFNYSRITLTGTAEKDSEINITLPLGDVDNDGNLDSETFIVSDSASNSTRVNISNCRITSNPRSDGIKEICDWQLSDFQLEKDSTNPGNVLNQIQINTIDNITEFPSLGLNSKTETIAVNVDLFAVTINLTTDIEFFSPNGDGRQDGINFTDISTNGIINSYILEIKDSNNTVVKSFSAGGTPPSNIYWDGRNEMGDFVNDGTYTYQFKVETTDLIEFSTNPAEIFAVTSLDNSVVITSPKTDTFSSRGVATVQGQAPVSLSNSQNSDLKVKICIDTISIVGECNTEFYTTVDEFGFFSTIVMLPRISSQDEHYITAQVFDKYGNETAPSNQVKVTTTINPPFDNVQIIPVLTGTNNETDYQVILDKLDNNQEITQADIDSLRSVIMRANVYQGTERVRLFFADHSQVSELSDSTNWNSLGYITGENETKLYQEFIDGTTDFTSCASVTCIWDFQYPLAPNLSGLYEVRFEGKLDVEVQNITAGFIIDGNLPTTPIILDINKRVGSDYKDANLINGIYYSNSEIVQIRGASDPNATIEVRDSLNNIICNTTSTAVGIWSCEIDLSSIANYSDPENNTYSIQLETFATLGLNTAQSLESTNLIIDKQAPQIISVDTESQWRKSGDVVDQHILANEALGFAISVDKQNPLDADQCINSTATYEILGIHIPVQLGAISELLVNSSNLTEANGSFVVSGLAVEGRYCTTIVVSDLAGNTTSQTQYFFIDNTTPEVPFIDITGWGEFNGVYTQPGQIAKGRLVPEFVHEESSVNIKAWGEENTRLEFYVDGNLIQTSGLVTGTCVQSLDDDKLSDGVNVADKDICLNEFNYPLTQNGKDYVFQVKSIDRSGNVSIISEDEVVYYDNQAPVTPETVQISVNGVNIPDSRRGKNMDVTAQSLGTGNFGLLPITNSRNITVNDFAEPYSDVIFSLIDTNGYLIDNKYLYKSGTGFDNRDYSLPETNGVYSIYSQSWDAAGNESLVHLYQFELDTIAPNTPSVGGGMSGIYDVLMVVSGEPGSTSVIGKLDKNGYASGIIKRLDINNDSDWETQMTFCTSLRDRAGNVSGSSCFSVDTPVRPPRAGECANSISNYLKDNESNLYISCIQTDRLCTSEEKITSVNTLINNLDSRSCRYYKDSIYHKLLGNIDTSQSKFSSTKSVNQCIENIFQQRLNNVYQSQGRISQSFDWGIRGDGYNSILSGCGIDNLGLTPSEIKDQYGQYLRDKSDILQYIQTYSLWDTTDQCVDGFDCFVRGGGEVFTTLVESITMFTSGNGFNSVTSVNYQKIVDDYNSGLISRNAYQEIIGFSDIKLNSEMNILDNSFFGASISMSQFLDAIDDPNSTTSDKVLALGEVTSKLFLSSAIILGSTYFGSKLVLGVGGQTITMAKATASTVMNYASLMITNPTLATISLLNYTPIVLMATLQDCDGTSPSTVCSSIFDWGVTLAVNLIIPTGGIGDPDDLLKQLDNLDDFAKQGDQLVKHVDDVIKNSDNVWRMEPTARGVLIENDLAETYYKDWFHIGAEDRGFFPLIDFQDGTRVVSLKSVDPLSSSALERMQDHIRELASRPMTIAGKMPDEIILDIRVPQNYEGQLDSLVGFGQSIDELERVIIVNITKY